MMIKGHENAEAHRAATGRLPHPIEDGIQEGRYNWLRLLRRATTDEFRAIAKEFDYGRELPNAHFYEAFRQGEAAIRDELIAAAGKGDGITIERSW